MEKPHRILSLDQSYTRTGLCVLEDAYPMVCESFPLLTAKASRAERRAVLGEKIKHYLAFGQYDLIVVERVRLHMGGKLNLEVALALMSLTCYVCDVVASHINGGPVKAIDTQAWKGETLLNREASKEDAVELAKIRYGLEVNHDAADALCIALAAYMNPTLLIDNPESVYDKKTPDEIVKKALAKERAKQRKLKSA